jgi:multiple sugar transport system substrate-binding protein
MTDVDGAIPATRTAIDRREQSAETGPERRYVEPLQNGTARPRPHAPTYAVIRTVEAIDKDLADHRNHPPTGP